MTDLLNPQQFPPPPTLLRGRNAPVVKFPLRWAHEYLAESLLLTPAFPIDVTGGITDFGLMGNGDYGNCGACGEVHLEMTTAHAAGVQGPAPDSPLAVERYNDYDGNAPAPGPGVDLASYLRWCLIKGYIKAFAPVDISNKPVMLALVAAGFGLYIGVNLFDANMDQFNNGQPFDVVPGAAPNPEDGHCVDLCASAGLLGPHAVITWGKAWTCTDPWLEACLIQNPTGEAFLIVTTEEQLAKFQPALIADVEALKGQVGADPAPVPPVQPPVEPPPIPAPPAPAPPAPAPAPEGIIHEIEHVVSEVVHDVEGWYRSAGDLAHPPTRL